MIILKKESPILIAKINNYESAFYEEVEEVPDDVKKYISTHKNAGSGSQIKNEYFWSNTYGLTNQKVFRKVSEGLKLEPMLHDKFLMINEINTFDYIDSLLDDSELFRVRYEFDKTNSCIINAVHHIKNLECKQETDFIKYSELFRGRHKYSISIKLKIENVDVKINDPYNEKLMTLLEIKDILKKKDCQIISTNYYMLEDVYFSHSHFYELEEVLTLNEASELCGKSEGAIRNAIKTGKLIEGKDWRKAGRITLINKKSLKNLYNV